MSGCLCAVCVYQPTGAARQQRLSSRISGNNAPEMLSLHPHADEITLYHFTNIFNKNEPLEPPARWDPVHSSYSTFCRHVCHPLWPLVPQLLADTPTGRPNAMRRLLILLNFCLTWISELRSTSRASIVTSTSVSLSRLTKMAFVSA